MNLISHPQEGNIAEKLLFTHLLNVAEKAKVIVSDLELDLSLISKDELARLAFTICLFHDLGKATSYFQAYIRGTRGSDNLTRHSLLSAVTAYLAVKDLFKSELWAYTTFLLIKEHHGNLSSFDKSSVNEDRLRTDLSQINTQIDNILKSENFHLIKDFYKAHIDYDFVLVPLGFDEYKSVYENSEELLDELFDENDEKRIELFFIINLLFSALCDSDKHDAARLDLEYFDNNLNELNLDVFPIIESLGKAKPEKFDPQKPINKLRNQFLNEIDNAKISKDKYFYTVTAPTGIGKTFGCLAFANRLNNQFIKKKRVIYCLPYTSIIDQNYEEFENVISHNLKEKYRAKPSRYLLRHHHLTSKRIINRTDQENYSYKDYLDDTLFVESWQSALIVTTFVQFFHSAIGWQNSFLKKFHNIVNSIVILDEIQNINPEYYKFIGQAFSVLGKRFNTYFLLITATQPNIYEKNCEIVKLVNSETYMTANVFNRVRLSLLQNCFSIESFSRYFEKNFNDRNCLLVLNTVKSAIAVYEKIKLKYQDYQVLCLTTNLTPYDRKLKIEAIRNNLEEKKRVIVVSTQLIEAGVDLSFKTVYRDFGPLDSIIQVAGRCNRNFEYEELGGNMYLFKLSNDKNKEYSHIIYDNYLLQRVGNVLKENDYNSSDFYGLSSDYYDSIEFIAKSIQILKGVCNLNYDQDINNQMAIKDFKIIEEDYFKENIFILRTKTAQDDMEELLRLKDNLKETATLPKTEKDNINLRIELLKSELKQFSISVSKPDLEKYKNIIKPEYENEFYKYISFQDQGKYAYDGQTGFLSEPKEEIPSCKCF
ncbi:MAG: CRISPR-associated helicase Cas3' [Candidatus Nanoarchaeia archaeon]|nr:CRISPR-associated helicase Cas3' [Candidatus Nanoarchaeia archaeon]